MKIDKTILSQLETLAKIEIKDAQKEVTIDKIQSILNSLDKINLAEIENLEPLSHPLEISQALREDIANSDIDIDYMQKQSPKIEDGLFLVPKVI